MSKKTECIVYQNLSKLRWNIDYFLKNENENHFLKFKKKKINFDNLFWKKKKTAAFYENWKLSTDFRKQPVIDLLISFWKMKITIF